jgi:hypothetical protein
MPRARVGKVKASGFSHRDILPGGAALTTALGVKLVRGGDHYRLDLFVLEHRIQAAVGALDFVLSATWRARSSETSATAISRASGTSRRKFSACRLPISPHTNNTNSQACASMLL